VRSQFQSIPGVRLLPVWPAVVVVLSLPFGAHVLAGPQGAGASPSPGREAVESPRQPPPAAADHPSQTSSGEPAVAPPAHAPASTAQHGTEGAGGAAHHEEPLWKTGARLFNFAVLAGTLVYFLRAPMRAFFDGRIAVVRADLVRAATMRATAGEQLAAIDARLQALPAELAELREKGARDITAERARIQEAAEAERQRLLAHSRAQATLRVRGVERELTAATADRVVAAASARLRAAMTDADQSRLIDRYLGQIPAAGGAAGDGRRA